MQRKVVLTGDRPTGKLHLGHFIGSLKQRVELQYFHDQYIMIADLQALTDCFEKPEIIKNNLLEVIADYIAVGINPELSTIFVQSQIPELSELTIYFMNLVSIARLERNPTIKSEIVLRGFSYGVPVGFLCYPISQAADIIAFKAEIIPVGDDQQPMIELTNEVVKRFNRIYKTECLKECRALLSTCSRLVGINGKAKASKSLNNAIFLSDPKEVIREKVYSMFTDPNHIKVSDPGNVKGNVVFTYLDAFYSEKDEVYSLKEKYIKGGLSDIVLKSLLNEVLQKLLEPIRDKRESLNKKDLAEICFNGSKKARPIAKETLNKVKDAIGINFSKLLA